MKFWFLFLAFACYADIESHLRKVVDKIETSSVRNIDFIYLINLDSRPEKYHFCQMQLFPYDIWPHRFPAIYGWKIPLSVIDQLGIKYNRGMWIGPENALHIDSGGAYRFIRLGPDYFGKTVFSSWLTPGALGCTLSHLSVLLDAENSDYNTIWILEDDFVVKDNPHRLSELIEELDATVDDWDILYTDPTYLWGVDESKDLLTQLPMKWRPDMPGFELEPLLEHTPIGKNFLKIGSRIRTHSMIIRKSGIAKILDFYRNHNIFLPYDHELFFIPGLRFYALQETLIDCKDFDSDTKNCHF